LIRDTAENYYSSGYGVILGFEQHIRDMWSGGVEMRWSDWRSRRPDTVANTSPLSIYSKIEAAPSLSPYFKNEYLTKMFRPYLTGALGYTLFFDNRSFLAARSKTAFTQTSITYGGGLRIVLPASFSIKLGAEEWRGIQDTSYFSNIFCFVICRFSSH
jgi:opacity protein-like surface antigen